MRHEQRRHEYWHHHSFGSVDSNVTSGPNSRQHERQYAFEWKLQDLNHTEHNQPCTQSHELRTKRYTPVA
jgi:hypothetical protein